jgi:ketosteroid isomerase-like protein
LSGSNAEIFRRGIDAWITHDVDASAETLDPNVVLRFDAGSWVESGAIYSARAVLDWFEDLAGTVGREIRIVELIDCGDRIVARLAMHFRGRASGVEGENVVTQINTYRNGKVILIEFFGDHAEALRTVTPTAPH